MPRHPFPARLLLSAALLAFLAAPASAPADAASDKERAPAFRPVAGHANIASAWLIGPTKRYDHFVQGRDYEASGLRVRLASGETLTLRLPEHLVFEDSQPRLGDLDGDGGDEIVLVLSSVTEGSALAVFAVREGALALLARTGFIGQPHRWRNIAGLGDFDGDGRLDIASVAMPHLVKRLDIHTLEAGALVRIGGGDGFSNHRLGSVHTGLALVADFDGDGIADLALPDANRTAIRFMGFAGRTLTEISRSPLPAPVDGVFEMTPDGRLSLGLETGQTVAIALPGR